MATKEELQQSFDELKQTVQGMSDTVQSAETALHHLADLLTNSLSATDLDALKQQVTDIRDQVQSEATGLAQAIADTGSAGGP